MGNTVIGENTKIDNLVQVGHNCIIGHDCIFCAFVGLSGNTTVGNYVLMSGQAGTKGHLKIGDRVQVGAQSGISKDVPSDSDVKGYPARPLKEYIIRNQVLLMKMTEIYRRLIQVEKKQGIDPKPREESPR